MKFNYEEVKKLCKNRGLSLNTLLRRAGVSKTAYYAFGRRLSLLPKSIHDLASELSVSPGQLLSELPPDVERVVVRTRRLNKVLNKFPEAVKENVWHSLIMLEMKPVERLRGALRRGRKCW